MSISEVTDKKGPPPYKESFVFGMYERAYCGAECFGRRRKSFVLKKPIFAGKEETEVLISAGRQSFHPGCLAEVKEMFL